MSPRIRLIVCAALAGAGLAGCQQPVEPIPMAAIEKDYDRELPKGQYALRKIDPSRYPAFGEAWYRAKGPRLRGAIDNSIDYLNKPSSRNYFPSGDITHEKALASLELFRDVVDQAASPDALDQAIRDRFDVYISVGCDNAGTVLFTGYYSPIFEGSLTRTERFRHPLYRLPPDFEKDPEGNPIQGLWNTRREIETGGVLDGNEIVWLRDRFEAYVLTVQGSGFIRLQDGTMFEIGYAGHNGHDYVAVGPMLVADGKIGRRDLSLDGLIRFFRDHPQDMDRYLFQNKRYVFFQEADGGPFGCLGQPVTEHHTVATDKDIFPRACLAFVDTQTPRPGGGAHRPFRAFVLDQDRGAAIRAPGRCDIYMGVGEEAGRQAGYTYNEGKLYYLFAKEGVADVSPVARGADDETDRRRRR